MAFSFRGQMVDFLHLSRARTIIERAKRASDLNIGARSDAFPQRVRNGLRA
jgi:hypothetical protein